MRTRGDADGPASAAYSGDASGTEQRVTGTLESSLSLDPATCGLSFQCSTVASFEMTRR